MKKNKYSTPEEAAKIMIKDTKEFDVNNQEYIEGFISKWTRQRRNEFKWDMGRSWKSQAKSMAKA